jgi:hypothetical protein
MTVNLHNIDGLCGERYYKKEKFSRFLTFLLLVLFFLVSFLLFSSELFIFDQIKLKIPRESFVYYYKIILGLVLFILFIILVYRYNKIKLIYDEVYAILNSLRKENTSFRKKTENLEEQLNLIQKSKMGLNTKYNNLLCKNSEELGDSNSFLDSTLKLMLTKFNDQLEDLKKNQETYFNEFINTSNKSILKTCSEVNKFGNELRAQTKKEKEIVEDTDSILGDISVNESLTEMSIKIKKDKEPDNVIKSMTQDI